MNRSGQALSEFMIVTLFLLLPLLGGGVWWFNLEWNRSKCAYESFFKARQQLVTSSGPADYTQICGKIHETIHLENLEALDHDKGALGVEDLIQEASQFWEQTSSWWPSLPDVDSPKSSLESTILLKLK